MNYNAQFGSACERVPVFYLASSVVVVGIEDRSPFSDLGCALRHRPAPVLRSHPGVVPWLPHEGPASGEGGRGHRHVPPHEVLHQTCSRGELRRKVEVVQVALKRPAAGHILTAVFMSCWSTACNPHPAHISDWLCGPAWGLALCILAVIFRNMYVVSVEQTPPQPPCSAGWATYNRVRSLFAAVAVRLRRELPATGAMVTPFCSWIFSRFEKYR